VTVHFLPEADVDGVGTSGARVAYAVGRKVGGAVVRNRWRRRLRAIAAQTLPDLPSGAYLISLGPEVEGLRFEELRERVVDTMRKASGVRR
jgi:ribonuclease P protein component